MVNNAEEVTNKRELEQNEEVVKKQRREHQNKYRVYNQIINSFYSELSQEESEIKNKKVKQQVKIIPEIIYNNQNKKMKIEFKIGISQFYRIKNLIEFYDRMMKKEVYKYGTKLEFQHIKENFDKEDESTLQFLMKYAEIIKFANEGINSYEYYGRNLNASSIMVSNTCLDDLFEVFQEKEIDFQNNYNNEKLYFSNEAPKIKFYLEEYSKEEYRLYTDSDIFEYSILEGKQYIYVLKNTTLYRCDKSIKNTVLKMLKMFKENYTTEIILPKEESPKFFSLVMPKIKGNLKITDITPEEFEKYVPAELYVKVFLDYDKNNYIVADIKFCYRDIEFNPLKKFETKQFARDIAKENKVMDMFVKSGFMFEQANSRLILVDEAKIYQFLSEDIEDYMREFEVLATDNFKAREIKHPKMISIGVKVENNLLKVDLEGLNFDSSELAKVMEQYKLKKKYFRLKDGTFISLEKNETFEFLQGIENDADTFYSQMEKQQIQLPIYRTLYLDKLLENVKTTVRKDENYNKIIDNIQEKNINGNIELPTGLNADLRLYQKVGFQWLKNIEQYNFGGILADDMGLGKTLQLIAMLLDYKKNSNELKPRASLVVCPSSLSLNWENEIKKFAPELTSIVIAGNSAERKLRISQIQDYNIVITSYDLLKRDIEEYEKMKYPFKYIIADEAQYIKNNNTQNFKAIKKLKGDTRYALTGTPIENSLSELWSIFDFIMPGYLFSYKKFKGIYELPIVRDESSEMMKKLKMLIEPFVLRRIKEEVLTELPDKTITVLNNEMDEEQFKVYMSYMVKAKKEVAEEISVNGFEKSQIKILSLLMRLRQICCHPSLFIENYKGESSKLTQCIELVKDAIQSGHKILLFSGYTSMFEIIQKELQKEGINYYKLTGQTKVGERLKLVDEFNNNSDVKVFLISLKAGGTGLNLIGADTVIHYDPWWNLSTENQATDRMYRIGQKRNVQVYKLITKNSIEEKIYELQQKKAKLIDNMLSTKETFISKLSKEEIMELFK